MNIDAYLKEVEQKEVMQTGITKENYLDIMELCLNAFSTQEIEGLLIPGNTNLLGAGYEEFVKKESVKTARESVIEDIHSASRITSVIGILLSYGRKTELKPLWEKLMIECCLKISTTENDSRNDFGLKEIMLSYFAMEKQMSPELKKQLQNMLARIDPYKNYKHLIRTDDDIKHLHNINIYNMAGEYLREVAGLTDASEYFKKHWKHQLKLFDENGMYIDPGCPMLYDIATRCQIQIMLSYGYKGEYFKELDENLEKAGKWSLLAQTAAFGLPFGGRSNQYLFNDGFMIANFEYEAARHHKHGNEALSQMYKRAAHLTAVSLQRWLKLEKPVHIKNFYPTDSLFGTEGYGYYAKYMISLACFIYISFLAIDDDIKEQLCPAEVGGYVLETTPYFHKIFANCCGQSIAIDTKADFHYDATGLGSYQKIGIPCELALAMPFTAGHLYNLPRNKPNRNVSICAGWETADGKIQYLSQLSDDLKYKLKILEESRDCVRFQLTYFGDCFDGCDGIMENYQLDHNGLTVKATLLNPIKNKIYFTVPLFHSNGLETGTITTLENGLKITNKDADYTIVSNGSFFVEDQLISNRNGEYKLAVISNDMNEIQVNLILQK